MALLAVAACSGGLEDDRAIGADVPDTADAAVGESGESAESGVRAEAGGAGVTTTVPDERDVLRAPAATASDRCRPDLVTRSSATDDPLTLTVWHTIGNDVADVFVDLLDRFQTDHPGIELVIEDLGGLSQIETAFTTAATGELPDLIMGQADAIRSFADSGRFVPPAACTGGDVPEVLSDLLPVVAGTYTVGNDLVAVPFLVSTPVLVFDTSTFRAAGLDPDRPPSTPDELADAARALVSSGVAPRGLAMYDRAASWLVEQWAAREGRPLLEPANGHGSAGGEDLRAVFGGPDDVAALTWLRELADGGLVNWLGLNESGVEDLFALVDPTAPAGMTLHTSAAIGDLTRLLADPDTPFPDAGLGIGALPGPGRGALVGGNNWWIVDDGDPVRAGAAWLLAEWLASPDQQALLTTLTGYAPATAATASHPDVVAHWAADPNFAVPYRQLTESGSTPGHLGMQAGPRVAVQRLLEIAAAAVVTESADPVVALDRARERADELLALYAATPAGAD